MFTKVTRIVSFVFLAGLFVIPAYSQLDSGAFSGCVTDASGAVVPGADVAVVNTATNFYQ